MVRRQTMYAPADAAKSAYQKINLPDASGFFGTAQSLFAPCSESVCFVHVEQYVFVHLFQPYQFFQIGSISVHAENTFGDDNHLSVCRMIFGEQPFQLFQIIVPVADTFG